MKRKNLKLLSIVLSGTMIFGTVLPASAYNLDENHNSIESVEYQNTEDEDFSNVANVFAQLGSEYKVTIPKTIVLSGTSKDAKYYVKVAGDIAGYEKVSVIPENSFKLSAKNKADETATISQDKTVWTVHDFDTDANGLVEASSITAGKWQGTFNFNINLESDDVSALPEEKILGDLIVPDANEWKGQELSDIYVMEVGDTGILEATNDGKDVSDALEITSSNEDVVKIENKQLKAVNAGQTTITTVYEDKSFSVKIKVVKPETPAHIHTAGEAVKENEIAATYEKEGSYEEVIYCTDCGEEISRTTKVIPKLLAAGLYDENDNLIKSWDELVKLGLDIEKDYADYDKGSNAYNKNASSGYCVFSNNNLSGKLIIPNSVTKIGDWAFCGCASLKSIEIPDSVTSISDYAFNGCISLTSIIIPNSVTSIGSYAFYYCTSLESITIPDSVTSIGDSTFNSCTSLTQVTIPDSVTSIGQSAFVYCTTLESVTLGKSVTSINDDTFGACLSLKSVTISDSVTSIGNYAFYNCKSLESVAIPDSVTSIGDRAFGGCTSVASINADSANQYYCSENGVLFNKDKTTIIYCPNAKSGAYTIPNSVTSINDYAFYDCASLESVTIPDSVTKIGMSAFGNCTSLTQVTIPNSVRKIGNYAFGYCLSLTSITFRGVTYTDKATFNNKLIEDGIATKEVWY